MIFQHQLWGWWNGLGDEKIRRFGGFSVNNMVFFWGLPGIYVGFMGSGDVPQSGMFDVGRHGDILQQNTRGIDEIGWWLGRYLPDEWCLANENGQPSLRNDNPWGNPWQFHGPRNPGMGNYLDISRWYQNPWNMTPLYMVYLLKMVIFHGYMAIC